MPTQVKLTELFPARFRGAVLTLKESTMRTGDATLEYEDRGKVVPVNAPGAAVITVPTNMAVPFPLGTVINVYNVSETHTVQIVGAPGVNVISVGDILTPLNEISLRKRDTNEWVVAGALA